MLLNDFLSVRFASNRTSLELKHSRSSNSDRETTLLIEPVWNRNTVLKISLIDLNLLLIEPVWNRNCDFFIVTLIPLSSLLIEPIWNRNPP